MVVDEGVVVLVVVALNGPVTKKYTPPIDAQTIKTIITPVIR
jgi:hypothetical protein